MPTKYLVETEEQLINDYLTGFYTNIHPLIFLETERKYKKQLIANLFSDLLEGEAESVEDSINIIDDLIDNGIRAVVRDIFSQFAENLNSIDLEIFKTKLHAKPLVNSELKKSQLYERWNDIQYRLVFFIILDKRLMYEDEHLIRVVNKYPKQNMKYLKTKEITVLPDKADMAIIVQKSLSKVFKPENKEKSLNYIPKYPVLANWELKTVAESHDRWCKNVNIGYGDGPNTPIYSSNKDKNGIRHKRAVVFINSQGWAWDFSTKTTWFLG